MISSVITSAKNFGCDRTIDYSDPQYVTGTWFVDVRRMYDKVDLCENQVQM